MAGLGQPAVERLRGFLRELPEDSRALLIAELERGMLRGEDRAGAEFILNELRRSIRESQSSEPRIGEGARLFFQPLQPFLRVVAAVAPAMAIRPLVVPGDVDEWMAGARE